MKKTYIVRALCLWVIYYQIITASAVCRPLSQYEQLKWFNITEQSFPIPLSLGYDVEPIMLRIHDIEILRLFHLHKKDLKNN